MLEQDGVEQEASRGYAEESLFNVDSELVNSFGELVSYLVDNVLCTAFYGVGRRTCRH